MTGRARPAGARPRGWTAALPMYDLPELRAATDAWWAGIARHLETAGIDGAPDRLTRPEALAAVWDDPALLVGQGCGYPFTHGYADRWQYLATPVYAAPGCAGVSYCSWLVVRANSDVERVAALRGRIAAVNAPESHSGCLALRAAVAAADPAPGPAFAAVLWTGGHRASLHAVAEGRADVAAIDCVSHALLAAHAPEALAQTRVLAASPAAPGLPLIAGRRVDAAMRARVRDALRTAVADPELAAVRRTLLIADLAVLPAGAYDRIGQLAAACAQMPLT